MELESVNWVRATWTDFGRHYYAEAEQVYVRWLEEMREAGFASPTGLPLCMIWLYRLAWGRVPKPWRWAAVLITLLSAARRLQTGAGTPE